MATIINKIKKMTYYYEGFYMALYGGVVTAAGRVFDNEVLEFGGEMSTCLGLAAIELGNEL